MKMTLFNNPFRPGAGQLPPYLAGRQDEQNDVRRILNERPVITNVIITGLRGVGKTVLLETLKPLAINSGCLWAGTDLSETASVSEQNLSIRIMADISTLISGIPIAHQESRRVGFSKEPDDEIVGSFDLLTKIYSTTPGLSSDKLKAVIEFVWNVVKDRAKGIVLAYDEAQILKDQAEDKQYPLSLLLEVIQYLQRKQIPVLLILTGLPTLFPNLVETRTYAERMFHVITLDKLSSDEVKDAITKPIEAHNCPVHFTDVAILEIVKYSGGYPYFIQFICKETFDSYIQQLHMNIKNPFVTIPEIVRKLDTDFYSGRWGRLTDRQRDLMIVISNLNSDDREFSVADISEKSKEMGITVFTPSYVNQTLVKLIDAGLVFKNRHGKYSFAVPMLADFIQRQIQNSKSIKTIFEIEE